jgi:hypothetical protein
LTKRIISRKKVPNNFSGWRGDWVLLEAFTKLGGVGGKEKKLLCLHQAHDWEILMDLSTLKKSLSLRRFLLRILLCNQCGHHPENNSAKFGYILDMKVEKEQNPSVFLATY